jgi:hypothetical protein
VQALQDILTKKTKKTNQNFSDKYKNFDLFSVIYYQSILNRDDYDKTCAWISFKTCNNQQIIDNMPYYVFNNYMVHLNEIIEKENAGNGSSDSDSMQNNAQKQFSSSMRNAKSMMPNISGNLKPKF